MNSISPAAYGLGDDVIRGNEILAPNGKWYPRQRGGETAQAARAAIPFTGAAHEHTEVLPNIHVNKLIGAATQTSGPIEIPAFGYLRHIWLHVDFTGGTLGAGVLHEDFPFNVIQSVTLLDVNGAPICGPIDGYALMWANVQGGYAAVSDPRELPNFDGTINGEFAIRVPIEINHYNGLGSLANQNSAAAYKLEVVLNTSAALFSTAPTTPPSVTVTGVLEAWTLPNETDAVGNPQQIYPDGHGTTQFWTTTTRAVQVGANTIPITRVGNLIRNIIFINRTGAAGNARTDGVFPGAPILNWDARQLFNEPKQEYRESVMAERIHNDLARDAGVYIYSWDHSLKGKSGDGPPNLWLPTVQGTRLELTGQSAVAGSCQVIINDVAPVEVIPQERYVETSASGYHPSSGAPVAQ